jgi:hypothetical protein
MMETKRNKEWRKKQCFRVFKARMIYYASFECEYYFMDGTHHIPQHWFELMKEPRMQVYRSTGTPCSCWMCRGKRYNRRQAKKTTKALVESEML